MVELTNRFCSELKENLIFPTFGYFACPEPVERVQEKVTEKKELLSDSSSKVGMTTGRGWVPGLRPGMTIFALLEFTSFEPEQRGPQASEPNGLSTSNGLPKVAKYPVR